MESKFLETIKYIVQSDESLEGEEINDEILNVVAKEVEYRAKELLRESINFMRKSKRGVLMNEDINHAFRLRSVEGLFSFQGRNSHRFRRVVGAELEVGGEIEIKKILQTEIENFPKETTLSSHWLAIQGVQPSIHQNPITEENFALKNCTPPPVLKCNIKHTLSKELQLFFETITKSITLNNGSSHHHNYYSSEFLLKSFESLSQDSGINQLVPYFIHFIHTKVYQNLHNLKILIHLMEMSKSLIINPNLQVEPYLHILMPYIMTCLVGKKLCNKSSEDHYKLRDKSAEIISIICTKFSSIYVNLLPSVSNLLFDCLFDKSTPLTTQYGAIKGITSLGVNAIKVLILDHITGYMKLLSVHLESSNQTKRYEAMKCFDALFVATKLFLIDYFRERERILQRVSNPKSAIPLLFGIDEDLFFNELTDVFGDPLKILLRDLNSNLNLQTLTSNNNNNNNNNNNISNNNNGINLNNSNSNIIINNNNNNNQKMSISFHHNNNNNSFIHS